MNENNKVELREDEINAVSGGLVVVPPYKTDGGSQSSGCFFSRESDTKYRLDPNGVDVWWACTGASTFVFKTCAKHPDGQGRVTCTCWGTDSCVDMWHKHDANGKHK